MGHAVYRRRGDTGVPDTGCDTRQPAGPGKTSGSLRRSAGSGRIWKTTGAAGAGPIETHGRLFNYPAESSVRSLASRDTLGFKSIFLSNSFAAYRRTSLDGVGGFPTDVILGEDTVTAAHLLMKGWNIHYVADAEVYHSHDFSWWQEFQRYFDTGVLHSRESWLHEEFGKTGAEGQRFLRSELSYLWRADAARIPSALVRTAAKLAGYRLGRMESKLTVPLKVRLSMYKVFWKGEASHL